jgi:2-polyprenyl-6-methoxyphenol hydroxylase-like FAD-dependent oxidoreductase
MGSSGVIGYLPLPGNLVSVVWSTSDDLSGKINEETILSELKNRYDPLNIVSMESGLGRFPLKRGTPSSAAIDRVILVGDAAHQFLPLAGQGLNVGLADVETLASVVKEYGDVDPGCLSVTNRYRRARREEIESFTRFTELIHDTSSSDKAVYRTFQRFGFGAVNQIGILKRFFIDKALG